MFKYDSLILHKKHCVHIYVALYKRKRGARKADVILYESDEKKKEKDEVCLNGSEASTMRILLRLL